MLWPADHPLHTDARLARSAMPAAGLCGDATVVRVLRYVPGRRVATLLATADGPAVVKVFSSPRGRGNHRRLSVLAACSAAGIVPASLGCDPSGHVHLVRYYDGTELDLLPDEQFIAASRRTGSALRQLHDCGAVLDRTWTRQDELDQLVRRMVPETEPAVGRALAAAGPTEATDLVCAHRDCHPRQVIVDSAGEVRWIDLDEAAMAPRGLDVGNMVAHLTREWLRGKHSRAAAAHAIDSFLTGYGHGDALTVESLDQWTELALLRLAGLALSRHNNRALCQALLHASGAGSLAWRSLIGHAAVL